MNRQQRSQRKSSTTSTFAALVHLSHMAKPVTHSSVSLQTNEASKAGDHSARELTFRALSGPMYSMAFRILADRPLAEEVTLDTFVDVFTKIGKLREHHTFLGWVRKIAINHCHLRLRSPW